jgi:hypothetical protein
MKYRNISSTPQNLDDGRVVGIGDFIDLKRDEVEDNEYNARLFAEGYFLPVSKTGAEVVDNATAEVVKSEEEARA